jgi:hypothetical protein
MVDFQEGLTAVKLLLILVFGHGDLCYHYCCFVGLLYFFVIPLIPSGAEAGFNLKQIILQQILLLLLLLLLLHHKIKSCFNNDSNPLCLLSPYFLLLQVTPVPQKTKHQHQKLNKYMEDLVYFFKKKSLWIVNILSLSL